MKLSELIADAEKTLKEHGDIPVVVPDVGCGCCRDYTFDPAAAEVERDVESYGPEWTREKLPLAYIVR
ncbi:hypothetical protein [Streptomyces sp. NPDC001422]|uniref:hypothetical protein n=1 Tax=Streptomyces sp. NPDC001422 TaxID=3364575 RepID=UPI0036AB9D9D